MLTKKQYELLMLIDRRIRDTGVPPSFDEMKDALGLKSKSGIHRLISGLEERGFIRRLPHRARALEVLKLPENVGQAQSQAQSDESSDNVVRGDFGAKPQPVSADASSVELPLLGKIAAGTPIEAITDPSNFIDVPASMLAGGEHYALEVDGDSMIDAGIFDGDTVIIKKADQVHAGDICVALVDREEVTLKYMRRKGDKIALEPANPNYETRIFPADRVAVQGRLVGLIRKY